MLEGDRVFLSAGYGLGCMLLEIKAGADGKLDATQLWKNLSMKTQFNSAAARDGFLYGLHLYHWWLSGQIHPCLL